MNEERDRKVIELYRGGMTRAQVARATGLSAGAVSDILRQAGEPLRSRGRRRGFGPNAIRLFALLDGGMSQSAAAREIGISRQRASQLVKARAKAPAKRRNSST